MEMSGDAFGINQPKLTTGERTKEAAFPGMSLHAHCNRLSTRDGSACTTLHRDGYLDTWRRPQRMGRPEMVYRLTRRSHDLFQADSHQFTVDVLQAAQEIYGSNAPEKLLYNVFKKKTAALKSKAKGDTVAERAKWLTHARDAEGYMAQFVNDNGEQPHILECHSPIMNLLEHYPIIARFEQDMFEAVLGTRVRRQLARNSGQYECAFYFTV